MADIPLVGEGRRWIADPSPLRSSEGLSHPKRSGYGWLHRGGGTLGGSYDRDRDGIGGCEVVRTLRDRGGHDTAAINVLVDGQGAATNRALVIALAVANLAVAGLTTRAEGDGGTDGGVGDGRAVATVRQGGEEASEVGSGWKTVP